MKKQDKIKTRSRARTRARDHMLEWEPLVEPFRDRWEWAFDRMQAISEPYPEEVDAIKRVRSVVLRQASRRGLRVDELLLALGLLIALVDRETELELPGAPYPDLFPSWVGPTHRFRA